MKKMLLLLIMLLLSYTNTYSFGTQEPKYIKDELGYCKLHLETLEFYNDLDYYKPLADKYSHEYTLEGTEKYKEYAYKINEIYAKLKDNNYWLKVYNQTYDYLDSIDCYRAINDISNKNNEISISKIYSNDDYTYIDSKIIVEGKGFNKLKNSNSFYLYLVMGKNQYSLKTYTPISDTKLSLKLPSFFQDAIKGGISNSIPYYQVKICLNNRCIYSNENEGFLTNDLYSYEQYYLDKHNIINARKKITNPNKVKIAIIDDGISLSHPDLTNNIWINSSEIPGNGKDDDGNGYIDDYNGWNFVYNGNNIKPLGKHGTKIAGIIGAQINNVEGVGGILSNIELMSVGVCDEKGCNTDNVIKGIKYAVDNGANIINLSLGGHQFNGYNQSYDEALKYAYEKNVIVIIAGGNGDVLSNKTNGINTKINKISPVCNYGNNYKNIISVGSQKMNGYRSDWSNYGECIDFFAMGEKIYSSSFLEYENKILNQNYASSDGTSFSAPIIAGIIGLGYEKYGKIDKFIVYDSLKESIDNGIIDANKYIEILGNKIGKQKINNITSNIEIKNKTNNNIKQVTENKINNVIDITLKNRINSLFIKLEKKYDKVNSDTQIIIYNKLKNKIDKLLKRKLSKRNKLILNYLNELIIKKINSIDVGDILNDFIN